MNENENESIDSKLQELLNGIWASLTDEQKEKAKACKTLNELIKLAGKEGIELPDEALDMVSGGCSDEGGGDSGIREHFPL